MVAFDCSIDFLAGPTEVVILNERGDETTSVASGEAVTVRVRSRFRAAICDPMVGILIRTRIGMDVYGTNTRIEQMSLGDFQAGRIPGILAVDLLRDVDRGDVRRDLRGVRGVVGIEPRTGLCDAGGDPEFAHC